MNDQPTSADFGAFDTTLTGRRAEVADVVRAYLSGHEIAVEEETPGQFSFALPGANKLSTAVRLDVGEHALGVHAFVCRNPDENHQVVYRWLLEKNLRLFGVAFAVDKDGDIYLDSRLPLGGVDDDTLDHLLGSVLTTADESFNQLLSLGFATAIRKEYAWRIENGQSTANLAAFMGWLEPPSAEV